MDFQPTAEPLSHNPRKRKNFLDINDDDGAFTIKIGADVDCSESETSQQPSTIRRKKKKKKKLSTLPDLIIDEDEPAPETERPSLAQIIEIDEAVVEEPTERPKKKKKKKRKSLFGQEENLVEILEQKIEETKDEDNTMNTPIKDEDAIKDASPKHLELVHEEEE